MMRRADHQARSGMQRHPPDPVRRGSPARVKDRPSPLQRFQRGVGNAAVATSPVTGWIQPKLKVGAPNDRFEQEADRVADQVMRMPLPNTASLSSAPQGVQRSCAACAAGGAPCSKCGGEEEIQRKPLAAGITPLRKGGQGPTHQPGGQARGEAASGGAGAERLFRSLPGGGRPLPASQRSFFEPRFGHGFGDVRIHTDGRAAAMAQHVRARAFTLGRDVVFGASQYRPDTESGRRLLAHELTHVVQQGGRSAEPSTIQRDITLTDPGGTAPHPPGAMGPHPSRAIVLNTWLDTLCPDGNWDVNAGTGEVESADRATFCAARPRRGQTHHTNSAHPTSCGCLCELTGPGSRTVEIQIDDNLTVGGTTFPLSAAGEGATVHNSPTDKISALSGRDFVGITGAGATTPLAGAGRTQTIPDPPWIIFGHEVCGHARLQATNMGPTQFEHATTPQGDRTTLDVENSIRREHSTVANSLGIRRGTFRARDAGGTLVTRTGSVYRASAGETLSGIAVRCGIAVANLRDHIWRFNGDQITAATQNTLASGEDLLIEGIDWHEVISGETMTSIAAMWAIPLSSLKRANPQITGPRFVIRPGNRLLIPAT